MELDGFAIGLIIVLIGVFVIIFSLIGTTEKSHTKFAVGGFIGFIPFGFGNDKRMFWVMMGIMLVVFLFYIILNLKIMNS